MKKEFWNERYKRDEYVYGELPNEFFKEQLDKIPVSGKLLLPAEGEGRNAVYAAGLGWSVFAFDQSIEAYKKAMRLASKAGVKIDYTVSAGIDLPYERDQFDVLGFVFAHFLPAQRNELVYRLSDFLKPGGWVIFEAYSKTHLTTPGRTGGPDDPDMLYSPEDITNLFKHFETQVLKEETVWLNEGKFHSGVGTVTRFVGKKRPGPLP